MKRIILTKVSPQIQLAHLYEHIFCNNVQLLFHKMRLFPSLDYMLIGKTYYGGIIYIELEVYTDKAIKLSEDIVSLELNLDEVTIMNAASEVLAEKEEPFASRGYEKIKQALIELHEREWVGINNLASIDVKRVRRKPGPFYIVEGKQLRARKLEINIMLDLEFANRERELEPLFLQVAWLISETLQGTLPAATGLFSFDDNFKRDKNGVGIRDIYKVAHGSEIDMGEILSVIKHTILDIKKGDGFARLMGRLGALSYDEDPLYTLPNIEKNYEDTLILVGSKGWQRIATEYRCDKVLKHTFVTVKSGREAKTAKLKDIL